MQTISPPPIVDHADRDLPAPTCATCQFSLLGTQGDPLKGVCRRRPPAQMQVASVGKLAVVTAWPEITADDWCGEYRRGSTIDAVALGERETERPSA